MKAKFFALSVVFGIIFLALLVTASAASASTIEITPDPIRDIISSSGLAKFNLVIKNTDKMLPHTITFSHAATDWVISFSEESITIDAGELASVEMDARPTKDVKTGSYIITVYAKSGGSTLGEADVKINIDEHATPIDVRFDLPEEVGPARCFLLTGELENKEIKEYTAVLFKLKSPLFEEPVTFTEAFQPLETKNFSMDVSTKPYIDAGTYHIYVNADVDSRPVFLADFPLKVKEQGTLDVNESISKSLLKETHIVKLTNLGNAQLEETYKANFTGVSRFFTFASPTPRADKQNGVKVYEWDISLAPGESKTIEYSVNFIPLVIIVILVVILLIYLYSRYRKILSIRKYVRHSETEKGEKTMNIQLAVKNLTGATIKDVMVEDYVPVPLHVISKGYKTLEPDIIKKEETRLKLIWKLDSLAPREERLLSYNIRSKLKVIGRLVLPPAKVSTKSRGEPVVFLSNRLSLYGKE